MHITTISLIFLMGCSGKSEPQDTETDTQTTDTADSGDDSGLEVEPFTLDFTGALETSLTFDHSSCTHPASTHLSQFWRDSTGVHTFVLVAEIRGTFEGVGHYDHSTTGANVKLQEEAGGGMGFFQADPSLGDTFGIDVDMLDEYIGLASGSFTFSSLHGTAGTTSGTPMPVPITCLEF